MKRILLPFDFTHSAEAALAYTKELAGDFGSEILLLCINGYPVAAPEIGLSAFAFQDQQEESLKELNKIKLQLEHDGYQARSFSVTGGVTEEINKLCLQEEADLIIMGISGHGNNLIKTLAGSSAVAVSKGCPFPVLIVPPTATYKKPQRMAFACKQDEEKNHPQLIDKAKQIAGWFNSDLHLIHIVPENTSIDHTEVLVDNYLEHQLPESTHRTFIVTEKKVSEGILSILKADILDWIIIEPKKHGFFENLFHQSVTTEIAFHSPVPVLSIH